MCIVQRSIKIIRIQSFHFKFDLFPQNLIYFHKINFLYLTLFFNLNVKSDPDSPFQRYDIREVIEKEFGGRTKAITDEVISFLQSPAVNDFDKKYFKSFPTINFFFMKFNCIHTSEADVERIFSYCGITLSTPLIL